MADELEIEEEETAKGEEGQPPLPGVTGQQTPTPPETTPEAVDEKGVPWMNRAKENERKLREREAELERLRNTPLPPTTPAIPEDPFEKEQREIRQQEIQKVLYYERLADDILEENLSELIKERPVAGQFRDEIRALMRPTRPEFRASKDALRQAMNQVIGNNFDKISTPKSAPKPETPATPKRLTEVPGAVISPTPRPGGASNPLTAEERAFSDAHDLESKGFTADEIREMMKRRKERTKK